MTTRIYQPVELAVHTTLKLNAEASHHLARVLRTSIKDKIVLFNGLGGEYQAEIVAIDKKAVTVAVLSYVNREVESPADIYLAQGISRGEKMDFTIQKAVELGVKKIIPLFTERCNVKLDRERSEKRFKHWQSIIISACEQSGRNQIPELMMPQTLAQWLEQAAFDYAFVLSPHETKRLVEFSVCLPAKIGLLVGPEGGLTNHEVQQSLQKGFNALNLGPRVLRTETAALVAITALQCHLGGI